MLPATISHSLLTAVTPSQVEHNHSNCNQRQWQRNKCKSGNFCCRAPPLFGSASTISCFGERFHDGQYSFVSFLLAVLLLTVLPVSSHFGQTSQITSTTLEHANVNTKLELFLVK